MSPTVLCVVDDFKKTVTPLVKQVRLHLIDANDLMKVQCTHIVLTVYIKYS